jgi:hypothetical protein
MCIVSSLRRKRDEIAATIAAYEARINAARLDLAALEQAARLFDPEGRGDETALHREFEMPVTPDEIRAGQREVWESELPPVKDQSTLLVARAEGSNDPEARPFKSIGVQAPGVIAEVAYSATELAGERIPDEFFYLNWP